MGSFSREAILSVSFSPPSSVRSTLKVIWSATFDRALDKKEYLTIFFSSPLQSKGVLMLYPWRVRAHPRLRQCVWTLGSVFAFRSFLSNCKG